MPVCDCGNFIQSGQQCQQCVYDDLYGGDGQRDPPRGDGLAYLGSASVDSHYCDICERVCETLEELADHECRPTLPHPDDEPGQPPDRDLVVPECGGPR